MIVASGAKVRLRRAEPADCERAYGWLVCSDLTPDIAGPPLYPEVPLPTFEAFCAQYPAFYFDGSRPFEGRALIIEAGGASVGFLAHGRVCLLHEVTQIDLWLNGRAVCGRGYGSEALRLASEWMQGAYGIDRFVVRPSRRNVRALRAARRAGFRETDLPPAQVMRELQLAAARYSDEVLLFRALPPPPARLIQQVGRVYVFIDSEFTSLVAPRLISLGAVSSDGAAFYCELSDWPREAASEFVRARVLPQLHGEGLPHPDAAERFARWLAERSRRAAVTLVSDSGFDRWALADLFEREDLPPGVAWIRAPVPPEELDAQAQALHLRRYHALDDAYALMHALLGPAGH
ncbi:MAG: GNAT family N-acetyltransferase [Sutterellaceae bacterium]|nr:3'-5' exoribonuclease [Burkholderiaceae bacterium]MCX7901587.1 3'-5' exoribonuclease [Burkholderiaceae bacterium]MDW8429919.1 GNAT family N-acetyltransferase [Sutterellaceae bacterium]